MHREGARQASTEEPATKRSRSENNNRSLTISESVRHNSVDHGKSHNGILERVSMKNFICHENLDLKLSPNVNFITGQNGSGKSAILAALVVCLGAKANATSRGSSLKGFIKDGQNVAEVNVQLKNTGKEAYKIAEYGNSIIVERRITRDGSSQYKIKDCTGRKVSTKREELDRILDHFNIQVDNPITILNQETSKNFLFSNNPSDKYKFFMRATLLHSLSLEYAKANEYRRVAQETLALRQQNFPELQREVRKWEQKHKLLETLQKVRDKVLELKNELAWTFVANRERELAEAEEQLKLLESRMPKYSKKVQESQQSIDTLKERNVHLNEKIMQYNQEGKEIEPQLTAATKTFQEKKKAHRSAEMERNKLTKERKRSDNEVAAIQERISEITKSSHNEYEEEKRRREERLLELEESLGSIKNQILALENGLDELSNSMNESKEDQHRLRTEDYECSRMISSKSSEMKSKVASKTNQMRKFGDYMPQVIQQIEDAHQRGRFHQKPKGPIGALLSLKDPEWALAVECCLKSYMTSFCVNDHHDERILEEIFKKVCPFKKPSTITSRFSTNEYDVSRGKAQSKFPTVLDMVTVEDPTIKNCLIDQRGIEAVILVRDTEEARRVMANSPPKNAREAYVVSGDQMFGRPMFRYYSSNQVKANFLTANIDEDIRVLEVEINALNAEKHSIHQRKHLNKGKMSDIENKMKRLQSQLNELIKKKVQIEAEISELKNCEDPAPVDIRTLEDEVMRCNEMIEELKGKLSQQEEILMKEREELVQATQKKDELQKRLREIVDSVGPFKEELAKIEHDLNSSKDALKHYVAKERDHMRKVLEARQCVEKTEALVEEDVTKATEICPRINTERTPNQVNAEIKQLENRLYAEQQEHGDPEEITANYYAAFKKFKGIRKDMAHQLKFLEEFNQVMLRRRKQFERLRTSLAMRSKQTYINLLHARKYLGKIEYDHAAKTLNLKMQPNVVDGEGAQDLRSLSGGERSFATVCFILALWDIVESPFRCLDEFDVFMDMVNRQMALRMILSLTKGNRDKYAGQFIFVSPLDMRTNEPLENGSMFRMPSPPRNKVRRRELENGEHDDNDENVEPGPSKRRK